VVSFFLGFLELLFLLGVTAALGSFFMSLLFAWSWAQHQSQMGRSVSLIDYLRVAAVEWGAFLTLVGCHFRKLQAYHEAPPLLAGQFTIQQVPVIFVPSLHSGVESFQFLFWRLKKNYWNSLWPFRWKSFLEDPSLLEDQLHDYILKVIEKTKTQRFRIVSFGSSRPLVSRVLSRSDLTAYCDRWIAVSAPLRLPSTLRFVSTKRLLSVYVEEAVTQKHPDLMIIGDNDTICYPREIFGESRKIVIDQVGHFGTLLHSTTTQSILKELVV
jgi:hypothetical protein